MIPDPLPAGLELVRTTEIFDAENHPAGLRRAHRVAGGVWGRLVVHTGALTFVFEDSPGDPLRVTAGASVAIPPGRLHHVDIDGPVTFAVEFHRKPEPAQSVDIRPWEAGAEPKSAEQGSAEPGSER